MKVLLIQEYVHSVPIQKILHSCGCTVEHCDTFISGSNFDLVIVDLQSLSDLEKIQEYKNLYIITKYPDQVIYRANQLGLKYTHFLYPLDLQILREKVLEILEQKYKLDIYVDTFNGTNIVFTGYFCACNKEKIRQINDFFSIYPSPITFNFDNLMEIDTWGLGYVLKAHAFVSTLGKKLRLHTKNCSVLDRLRQVSKLQEK